MWRTGVTDVLVGGTQILAVILAAPVGRRRYNRWGATNAEIADPMPGDELVTLPMLGYTRAITIEAPPQLVWPWLVQMGQGRGGLYSFDGLENLAGCDIHSADRILADFQQLEVGDLIRLGPVGYPCFRVDQAMPGESLVLVGADPHPPHARSSPDSPAGIATWQWQLRPIADAARNAAGHPPTPVLPADDGYAGHVAPGRTRRIRHGTSDAARDQATRRALPLETGWDTENRAVVIPVGGSRPRRHGPARSRRHVRPLILPLIL